VIRRAAVFVRPRFVPNTDLLVGLGCAVHDNGWVVADATGRTSVPGVWVAGNAANARAQVITAAGEGSSAAISLNADLVDEDVQHAVRDFRGGYMASSSGPAAGLRQETPDPTDPAPVRVSRS
jgi:NADPH-dependent 2,4-dienoyl-CoA reductase/sulfur reductase-like enzyme